MLFLFKLKNFTEKRVLFQWPPIVKGIFSYLGLTFNQPTTTNSNNAIPKPPVLEHIYRVRISWEDVKTQKGAFSKLQSALDLLKILSGYKVFDENGKVVGGNNNVTTTTPIRIDTNLLSLQKSLNRLGFKGKNGLKLSIDGISSDNSIFAIKVCQWSLGLSVDGIAGVNTINALNSVLAKPLLKVGSKGVVVRYLQSKLGVVVDGVFGNDTKNSLIVYQNKNGLESDGIAGNRTWNKLII